jgi:PAS domain S-box-containing protein
MCSEEVDRQLPGTDFLAVLVESSNEAIISCDANSTIATWNAAAQRLFGYLAAEAIAQPLTLLAPPDVQEDWRVTFTQVLQGHAIAAYATPSATKTGHRIELAVGAFPLRGADGQITGAAAIVRGLTTSWLRAQHAIQYCAQHLNDRFELDGQLTGPDGEPHIVRSIFQGFQRNSAGIEVVTITHDITEHRALEQLLQGTNAMLEQRVRTRTAELATALAELEHAAQLKDEFMAAMNHELRTPLTGVLAMTESLELQVAGTLTDRQLRYVHGIHTSGDRLLQLVDSILRYTALQGSKVTLQHQPCRLSEIGAFVVGTVRSRAEEKGLSVVLRTDLAVPVIHSDSDGIIQVLQQLLDNAIKFTPAGGKIGLDIGHTEGSDTAQLVVWDTGIGINAGQYETIFQPFVQADRSLARRYEGTGLGLAYVWRIVELLRGTVSVESTVGAGSRFIVTLPIH